MKFTILGVIISIACLLIPSRDTDVICSRFMMERIQSDTIKPIVENGLVLVQDTSIVFNPETYEEQVKITSYYVTVKKYEAILSKKKRKAERRARKKLIVVRDTCIVFNPETFVETITVTTTKYTKREYKEWLKKQKEEEQ